VPEQIDRVVKEIRESGGQAVGIPGNVVKEADQARFIQETIAACILHCIENDAINATTIEVTGGLTYARSRAK
jgi:hypothetical protein